jgi:hypothetical protein
MSSVNRPLGSGIIGNVVSFAQNHIFSSRHSLVSKLAALALAVGIGYILVQGIRQWFAPAARQENEEDVTNLFFRITEKNIPPNRSVYLLGSDDNRPSNQYPTTIVQSLMNCQVLVSSLPISQRPAADIREFVVETFTLTLDKLRQKDESWFRSQFELLGCRGEHLKEQLELVRKAQIATDLTLGSWEDRPSDTIEILQKHLRNYQLDLLKAHPLIVMGLLGNELDLLEESEERIECKLIGNEKPLIALDETHIMSANLTYKFIDWLAHFKNDSKDVARKIQMFCKRLDIGYSNDRESKDDLSEQPGLYKGRCTTGLLDFQSTIVAKNLAWRGQILEALQENQSTAIVLPRENLIWSTGMLGFLRSQGYKVELVNT